MRELEPVQGNSMDTISVTKSVRTGTATQKNVTIDHDEAVALHNAS